MRRSIRDGWRACRESVRADAPTENKRSSGDRERQNLSPGAADRRRGGQNGSGLGVGTPGSRFILRFDNEAACRDGNKWTAYTPRIFEELEVLGEGKESARVSVQLTYISSASNKWAEELSRNHYPFSEMRRRWTDALYGAAPRTVDGWVARVCAEQGDS